MASDSGGFAEASPPATNFIISHEAALDQNSILRSAQTAKRAEEGCCSRGRAAAAGATLRKT